VQGPRQKHFQTKGQEVSTVGEQAKPPRRWYRRANQEQEVGKTAEDRLKPKKQQDQSMKKAGPNQPNKKGEKFKKLEEFRKKPLWKGGGVHLVLLDSRKKDSKRSTEGFFRRQRKAEKFYRN